MPQEERASKRAAKRAATAAKGVASPTGSELRPKNRWDSDVALPPQKSGLKKSVRWADEVVHTGGFSIGGASKQQVSTQQFVASFLDCFQLLSPRSDLEKGLLARGVILICSVMLVDCVQGNTCFGGVCEVMTHMISWLGSLDPTVYLDAPVVLSSVGNHVCLASKCD